MLGLLFQFAGLFFQLLDELSQFELELFQLLLELFQFESPAIAALDVAISNASSNVFMLLPLVD